MRRWALLLIGVLAWAAGVSAQPADEARLARRLSVAEREAALADQRTAELLAEIESLAEFIDPATLLRLREIAAEPAPAPENGEATAVERAEAASRLARRRHNLLRAAVAELPLDSLRYRRLVQEVAREVAALRGLALQRPVESIVLTRTELRDLLARLLEKELTDKLVRGESLTWRALGLLPPDSDLRLLYSGLLEEQVGGLYNDQDGALYVVDTFNPRSFLGRVILAHEICHALQDQHFPIRELPFRTENLDQNLATASVLEGDATLLMVEWGAQSFQAADLLSMSEWMNQGTQQLEAVPPALVQSLIFPYLAGLQFLQGLQGLGAENWRDLPFRRPPLSTTHILHPERYWPTPAEPVRVELPAWESRDGFEEVRRGQVGEWTTRLVLTPEENYPTLSALSLDILVSEPVAVAGAAGWAGDLLVTVAGPDDRQWFVAWKTTWVEELDADEFETAFTRRVATWPGFTGSDYREWTHADGRRVRLHVEGIETLVLLASDDEAMGMAAAWLEH